MDSNVMLTALLVLVCAPAYADDDNDCPLSELLSGFPSADSSTTFLSSMCDPAQEPGGTCTVNFEGGSLTYNGNSSGSIAFYNVSSAYCLNDTRSRECQDGMWTNDVIMEKTATESFLQVWNIVLIVIGVVAFVVGDAIAAALGTWLFVKTDQKTDKAIAIAMVVVSVVIVLPVAGPVALIMYIGLKNLDLCDKPIQMKWWYKMLVVFTVLLKLLDVAVWIIQAGHSATQEFYGEGPLRDKNGMCVPHEPNTEQKMLQDVLVILSQAISLIVMVDVHVQALLRKRGTTESTDSVIRSAEKVETRQTIMRCIRRKSYRPSTEQKKINPQHDEVGKSVACGIENVTTSANDIAQQLEEYTDKTTEAINKIKIRVRNSKAAKNSKEVSDADCLKETSEITNKSYDYANAVNDLYYFGCNGTRIDRIIQAIKCGDFQELKDFIATLLECVAKCETAHQFVQEIYKNIQRSAEKAADNCKAQALRENEKQRKARKFGKRAAVGAIAMGTAGGVAASVAAGVVTFGVGTVVGLALTAAGSIAAGGAVAGGAYGVSHSKASSYEELENEYKKLGESYFEIEKVASDVLQLTHKLKQYLNAIHTNIERVERLMLSPGVTESLTVAVRRLGDVFKASNVKSRQYKLKLQQLV